MIDYPYVECSKRESAGAVQIFRRYPDVRAKDIARAKKTGRAFLKRIQKPDGSWYGSWAVCFTYGTWFGVLGLIARGIGVTRRVRRSEKRSSFYSPSNKPTADGERVTSRAKRRRTTNSSTPRGTRRRISSTRGGRRSRSSPAVRRLETPRRCTSAARCILSRQCANGDFPQQSIMGVFNANCMISYSCYRSIFPLWALGEYASKVAGAREMSEKHATPHNGFDALHDLITRIQ